MRSAAIIDKEEIMAILDAIHDPEIPVVTIRAMGMLRDVRLGEDGCTVIITPTYSGCPAMGIIEADIKATLAAHSISPVTVELVYAPSWTTDWMTDEAKRKMKNYGIAPPVHSSCQVDTFGHNEIACPLCGSVDTFLVSRFGATACKALYKCSDCKEPFEYFKCH